MDKQHVFEIDAHSFNECAQDLVNNHYVLSIVLGAGVPEKGKMGEAPLP
jgi:hypothetical protein